MIRLTVPDIGPAEERAVLDVLASGYLVQGRMVRGFEAALERYLGAGQVVAVGSGTAALHLALLGLGIRDGDEVLVSDFTFPATANAVIHCGATPVLVDVERDSLNMDPGAALESITDRTAAILVVHEFGRPADLAALTGIADERDLLLIEDAACALGSEFEGRKCGSIGKVGCFSFHPRKNITTGEGGAVVSDDGGLVDRVRALRSHGAVASGGRLEFTSPGFNYRMTEMGAALGLSQMDRLEDTITRKARWVEAYRARLGGIEGVSMLPPLRSGRDCHQSFVVVLDETLDRDRVVAGMRERGVETTIGTYALHREPLFRKAYGYRAGQLPVSDWAFRQTLTLPLYPAMGEGDVGAVCDALGETVSAHLGGGG